MPLVFGTQTRDSISPDSNSDLILLLLVSELVDTGLGLGFIRGLAQVGQTFPSQAIGSMEAAAIALQIPPGVVTTLVEMIGENKFFEKLEDLASLGLNPNGYYVWGNPEKGLPTGEFTRDSIFFTGGQNYTVKGSDPSMTIFQLFDLDPGQFQGFLGWIPGIPNFEWLGVWQDEAKTVVMPKVPEQIKDPSTLVTQQIDITSGNPFLNKSNMDRVRSRDSDVSVKTGVEINTTLLLLAGALAFTKARLISIPIAIAAIRSK